MSSRVLAGAEDIPLTDLNQHDNNAAVPIASSEVPPPYTAAAQPPEYNHHQTPPPSFTPKPLPKWYKRRNIQILIFAFFVTIILAAALGKTTSDRNHRDRDTSSSTPSGTDAFYNITKVHGLAAAECGAGTFVVWKVSSGHFWWRGVVQDRVGEWYIPKQKVDHSSTTYATTVPILVNITASCWEVNTGAQGNDHQIAFQFIYYDYDVTRTFVTATTIITMPRYQAEGVAPKISDVTIRALKISPEYNITSLAVASITPPINYLPIPRHYLLYLVPRDTFQPNGTADIVCRSSEDSLSGWSSPQILNATADNAAAGIAMARVDGGLHNANKTELHVVFGGEGGRLMYMNWTVAAEWSAAATVYKPNYVREFTPPPPFTLTIPLSRSAHLTADMPLSPRPIPPNLSPAPPQSNYTRLNLYWIANPDTHYSFDGTPTPRSAMNYLSISYLPITDQIRTMGNTTLDYFGLGTGQASPNPRFLAAAAYDPFPSQTDQNTTTNSTTSDLSNYTYANPQTDSKDWNERVQLFFVEADNGGGKIANYTYRKTSNGDYGWMFKVGKRIEDDAGNYEML